MQSAQARSRASNRIDSYPEQATYSISHLPSGTRATAPFGVSLASDLHCRPVRVMTPPDIFTSTCAALRKSMPSRPETPATTRMLETQKPPTHSRGTM